MLVYRVETQSGVGPFCNRYEVMRDDTPENHYSDDCWEFGQLMHSHLNDGSHPVPDWRLTDQGYNFGCDSIEALRTWFNAPMLTILAKYGYMVKVFNIKTVEHVSPGQVAFKKQNAVEVNTYPVTLLA